MTKINTQKYQLVLNEFKEKINRFSTEDKEKILETFKLAEKYHKGQIHQPNNPFIIHPLKVALALINLDIKNANMICAALLHDTVEDTNMTYDKIQKLFGKEVMEMVKGVTRKKAGPENEKERYLNKKKKFEETLQKSPEIRTIKCADWLSNLTDSSSIPKDHFWAKKFPRWQKEVEDLYLPLALKTNRKIYNEMKKQQKIFEEYIKNN